MRWIILQKWIIPESSFKFQDSLWIIPPTGTASSRPQLAGREVAFYSLDIISLSSWILQSSGHRGGLQITRVFFVHQWLYFLQLVSLPKVLEELGKFYWTPPLG